MADTLIDWLRAQVNVDEQIANAAARDAGGPEWSAGNELLSESVYTAGTGSYIATGPYDCGLSWELRQHIAEFDPARELRDVKAKRLIMSEWQKADEAAAMDASDFSARIAKFAFGLTLAAIATAYEDRPGYRKEWRP